MAIGPITYMSLNLGPQVREDDGIFGVRAAAMYTLIGIAKLNDVDPQAWLADVLARIAGTPQSRLHELLPWKWKDHSRHDQAV